MDNFAPGLRENVLLLSGMFRVVVFFLCVVGLMLQVHAATPGVEGIMRPIVRAIVVVALIGTLPNWFGFVENLLLSAANTIQEGYTEHPMRAATVVRETVQEQNDSVFALRRIGEAFYRALLWAAAKFVVLIASLLQLPLLLLQYILKLLCYLFLPVALGMYLLPSLSSLGTRYLQQTLAVLAWPIGFAVTELVAYHLITAYRTNIAIGFGLAPGELNASSFASVLGGLLGALWLIVGTLGTPFLMQMLFCSGAPISGGGQSALQQLYTMQQVLWMIKSVKTGGAALPLAAAAGGKAAPNGGTPPPPPPAVAAPPSSPSPAPAQPNSDPVGDRRTAALLASTQLPAPHTTI